MRSTIDVANDNIVEANNHLAKAHEVVETIVKGVIG